MQRIPRGVWILSDGTAGALNQSLGFVERLGFDGAKIISCLPRGLFRVLPCPVHLFLLRLWSHWCVSSGVPPSAALKSVWWSFLGLQPPVFQATLLNGAVHSKQVAGNLFGVEEGWPDLIVASGRKTAPASFLFKALSRGASKTVQIQHPRAHSSYFNVIITPEHDRRDTRPHKISLIKTLANYVVSYLEGPLDNIIFTAGSIHRIRPQTLEQAESKWMPLFKGISSGRSLSCLLIGGFTSNYNPDIQKFRLCLDDIMKATTTRNRFMLITFSRRSTTKLRDLVKSVIAEYPKNSWIWDEKEENPYMGMLV